jgi:hypothetical protein
LIAAPAVVNVVLRSFTSLGDANEIVALLCVQNAVVGLAALCQWRRCRQISCLLGSFLILFVTAIASGRAVYVLAGVYAVVGLWWMMGSYWDRLEGRFAAETHRQVPMRTAVVLGTVLLLFGVAGIAMLCGSSTTVALAGFMPTSGGNRWYDPFARGGVGDGDMLVSAKDMALSFGPVESDLFLDSDMPTLYDVFNELYGEPATKKRKQQRAVSLSREEVLELEQRVAEAKRSGREFSAVRRRVQRRRNQLADRDSTALLYVVGRTPLHLALQTYDQFDGATWSRGSAEPWKPELALETSLDGRPLIRVPRHNSPFSIDRGKQSHALKIVNLKTPRIPSPPHLAAVHIDRVDRLDFFGWTDDGVVQMVEREFIPQLTVVNVLSRGVNLQSLRKANRLVSSDGQPLYLALPEDLGGEEGEWSRRLKQVASAWSADTGPGWRQIESIVQHLRSDFVHDPQATAPEECRDVVGHFLDEGRGPDYLFASTAVAMLRSLGYPARLVTGFYAKPEKYDTLARQTTVQEDDVHCWAEVCVDGHTWVPIEPTPGFELPHEELTWGQWAAVALRATVRWVWRHRLAALVLMTASILAIAYRRELLDRAAWSIWRLGWFGPKRRRVVWTLRWLEWRAWLAGRSRPTTETLSGWYGRFTVGAPSEVGDNLHALLSLADCVLYAPAIQDQIPYAAEDVRDTCKQTMNLWTQKRFRCHQL